MSGAWDDPAVRAAVAAEVQQQLDRAEVEQQALDDDPEQPIKRGQLDRPVRLGHTRILDEITRRMTTEERAEQQALDDDPEQHWVTVEHNYEPQGLWLNADPPLWHRVNRAACQCGWYSPWYFSGMVAVEAGLAHTQEQQRAAERP